MVFATVAVFVNGDGVCMHAVTVCLLLPLAHLGHGWHRRRVGEYDLRRAMEEVERLAAVPPVDAGESGKAGFDGVAGARAAVLNMAVVLRVQSALPQRLIARRARWPRWLLHSPVQARQ